MCQNVKMLKRCQVVKKMSSCQKDVKFQKVKHMDYGGGSQKNLYILTSILMSHMMVTKTLKMFIEMIFDQF